MVDRLRPDRDSLERMALGGPFARRSQPGDEPMADADGGEAADASSEGSLTLSGLQIALSLAVFRHVGDLQRHQHHVDRISITAPVARRA